MTAIPIRRGATLNLPLAFFADTTELVPINLTGSTLTITESTFPVAPTLTMVSATLGTMNLLLSDVNTAALTPRRNYQASIKQVQADTTVVVHGPFVFATGVE